MSFLDKNSKYEAHTYDITLLHGATKNGEAPLTISLFNPDMGVCCGIQKLIQNIVVLLLTEQGTVRFNPDRGTRFLSSMRNANTEDDVDIAFRFAVVDVKAQIQDTETDDTPEDEKYGDVELADVEIFGDTVSMVIEVTSASGSGAEVALPLYRLV